MKRTWQFSAMDSLFFRDSRPMNAGESAWLESVFPPTGQTLQGAIRTAILDSLGVDYQAYKNDPDLREAIGDSDSLGGLSLTGPWLCKDEQIYFPVPLDVVKNKHAEFDLLKPSSAALESDLGKQRMPTINGSGFKPLENTYIDFAGMTQILQEQVNSCLDTHLIKLYSDQPDKPALADREPKVGLARDNALRTATEGQLFAIAPIRPRPGVILAIEINGLADEHCPNNHFLQRLGGEGKLAQVTSGVKLTFPEPELHMPDDKSLIHFRLILTTPALMSEQGWLPDGFALTQSEECNVWRGQLNGINLDIISACIGKPLRIGGWDHARHKSRPVQAFVPPGSVYFCTTEAHNKELLLQLHNSQIGDQITYGFGHILIGQWTPNGETS